MDQPVSVPINFEILAELGRGTTGIVCKARDTVLHRIVAIKTLPSDAGTSGSTARGYFQREAQVLASLTSMPDPNIPSLHLVGEFQNHPFYVREFIEGNTFEDLATTKALTVRSGSAILAAIARAVQRVHDRGFAHRNLHPSNILVGADLTPKLIGFGSAGPLVGSDRLPPGMSGVPVEVDVQALKELVGWLGTALGQPMPPLGAATNPAKIAETLESHFRAPSRAWWRFW